MAKKQGFPIWAWIVIGLLLLILLNQQGVINIFGNGEERPDFIISEDEVSIYGSCTELCIAKTYDFGYSANSITDCKVGESFLTYGYEGQPPLLSCCCGSTLPDGYTCSDSDGFDIYTWGHCEDSYHSMGFMDVCNGGLVQEYFCNEDNICEWRAQACPTGYVCVEGVCVTEGYSVGDIVGGIDGSGTLSPGDEMAKMTIDLSDVIVGGPCYLGARIWTSWIYVDPTKCTGIQGYEMVDWVFYDSSGPVWVKTDTYLQSNYVELCPLIWDGVNEWELKMFKLLNLPECEIDYTMKIEVFVCECD